MKLPDHLFRVRITLFVLSIILFLLIYPNRQFFASATAWHSIRVIFEAMFVVLLALFGFLAVFKDSWELWDRIKLELGVTSVQRELKAREMERNRENMLQKVTQRNEEYLKHALPKEVFIKLGFISDPEQVTDYPTPVDWLTKDRMRTIRRGTKLLSIFEKEAASSLLILGKPGAGKTISLLRLARDLIQHAQKDDKEPIPVVFNLSSWAEKQKQFAVWLEDQLKDMYQVPRRVGKTWIEEGALTLLLDGLDEINDRQKRQACVAAINTYRQQHNLVKTAVCSRIDEYEELTTTLNMDGAIVVRDIRPEDAKKYLDGFGKELTAVRMMLDSEPSVQELAKSPLTLSILAVAARGMQPNALKALVADPDRARQTLYDIYIERMLSHRGVDERYGTEQPKKWLAWLGFQLKARSQKEFLIDTLQSDWLPKGSFEELVVLLVFVLVFVLVFGLAFGLVGGLFLGLAGGLVGGLVVLLVVLLIVLLVVLLVRGLPKVNFADYSFANQYVWKSIFRWLAGGLEVGLVGGLVFALVFVVEVGLVSGLVFVLAFGLIGGLEIGLVSVLVFGLEELKSDQIPSKLSNPAQPIVRTKQLSFLLFVVSSIVGIIFFGTFFGFIGTEGIDNLEQLIKWVWAWQWQDAAWGLLFGPLLGLAAVLNTGDGLILHYTIKKLLARKDLLPLDLIPFLDFAHDRLLLIRTGGSYTFYHLDLQDHFAEAWARQYEGK